MTSSWRKGSLSELGEDGLGLLTDSATRRVYNFHVKLLGQGRALENGVEVAFHLGPGGIVDLVETRESLLALANELGVARDESFAKLENHT